MQAPRISRKDSADNGPITEKNSPIPIQETEYRYKFCGFPTGVIMLPRLAAIVCITMTEIISF